MNETPLPPKRGSAVELNYKTQSNMLRKLLLSCEAKSPFRGFRGHTLEQTKLETL